MKPVPATSPNPSWRDRFYTIEEAEVTFRDHRP